MKYPRTGALVCDTHGGTLPRVQAKAKQRIAEQQAAVAVRRFNARTDIDAPTALLELVQYQAGLVEYWRNVVERVTEAELTWSLASREEQAGWGDGFQGGNTSGSDETYVAAPHIAYKLLVEAQDKLAVYATSAIRAGLDERRVRIAEEHGTQFAAAQRRILARMFESVVSLARSEGIADQRILEAMRLDWERTIVMVVPEELRALEATT
jgi:hypothetical protein